MGMQKNFTINRRSFLKLGGAAAAVGAVLESKRLVSMEQALGGKDFLDRANKRRTTSEQLVQHRSDAVCGGHSQ